MKKKTEVLWTVAIGVGAVLAIALILIIPWRPSSNHAEEDYVISRKISELRGAETGRLVRLNDGGVVVIISVYDETITFLDSSARVSSTSLSNLAVRTHDTYPASEADLNFYGIPPEGARGWSRSARDFIQSIVSNSVANNQIK